MFRMLFERFNSFGVMRGSILENIATETPGAERRVLGLCSFVTAGQGGFSGGVS